MVTKYVIVVKNAQLCLFRSFTVGVHYDKTKCNFVIYDLALI